MWGCFAVLWPNNVRSFVPFGLSVIQSVSCSVSPSLSRFVNSPTRTQTVTQKQRQTQTSSWQRESVVEASFRGASAPTESSALWLLLYIDVLWFFFSPPPSYSLLSFCLSLSQKSRRNFANKTKSFNVYCRQLESLNNEPQFMSYIFGCGSYSRG